MESYETFISRSCGSETVTVVDAEHPARLEAVTVYVPAARFEISCVVAPFDQIYVLELPRTISESPLLFKVARFVQTRGVVKMPSS